MVQRRDDIVGLDSSIIMHPNIWKASGHVDGFSDPMVIVRNLNYAIEPINFVYPVILDGSVVGYIAAVEGTDLNTRIKQAKKLRDSLGNKQAKLDETQLDSEGTEITELDEAQRTITLGPDAKDIGTLTEFQRIQTYV